VTATCVPCATQCEAAGIEIKPKKQKREGGEKEAAEKKPNEKEPKSKLADIAPAKSAVQARRAQLDRYLVDFTWQP
jgi:hypothetical protein